VLQTFANRKTFSLILGALLFAGLFFFLRSQKPVDATGTLKPSQLDFSHGNAPTQVEVRANEVIKEKAAVPISAELAQKLSASETSKIQILDEVLKSKNDNDPRIDQELTSMSPALHEALFEKYESMEFENRNGRGMITFLIARDFKSSEDGKFLEKVFNESPCTSMANCQQVDSADSHHSGIEQNSLNYPQLAALYQLEAKIEKDPLFLKDRTFFRAASDVIRQAKSFPVPVVQEKAEQISQKYGL